MRGTTSPLLTLAFGAAISCALSCAMPAGAQAAPGQKAPAQSTAAASSEARFVDGNKIILTGPAYFEQYATADNPDAAFFTGYAYLMQGNPERAYRWIYQAATSDADLVDAWYFLGYLYSAGFSPQGRDLKAAREWFQKAANKNHIDAINQLYFITLLGSDSTPAPEAALLLASAAGEKADPAALNNLGVMHEFGIGTQKAPEQAATYYQRAATAENPSGHFNLARLFENGIAVDKDKGKAAQHYLIAADLGYAPAQYRVAQMMRNGDGFTQNNTTALEWFVQAAQQMNPQAMYQAGLMYAQGTGTRASAAKAKELFSNAVEIGHAPSAIELGHLRMRGVPTPEDLRQAYSWYHLAYLLADNDAGKNAAMDEREKVAEALNDAQRKSARRQAELRRENTIALQDAFSTLAEGVSIDMFANPATPRRFPAAMIERALHENAPADNKN